VIDIKFALTHHLFDISIGKLVAAISTNAEQDDIRRVVTPLVKAGSDAP
jgi:hypothetical protein